MSKLEIDRRVTLKWLAGAMAASTVPIDGVYAAPVAAVTPWVPVAVPPVTAPGYGTDPKLLEPVVPWPKTLTAAQLQSVAAVCDTILPAEGKWPAPSAIGIQHFVDEWVSAPYPTQQSDRATVLSGLAWLDRRAREGFGQGYEELPETTRAALLTEAAKSDPKGQAFLNTMKFLTTGAYYTSEQGIEELGYIGNTPMDGDYPGPTPEALAHLDGVLASLNLKRK